MDDEDMMPDLTAEQARELYSGRYELGLSPVGELERLRAALDAERHRAEQAERDRDNWQERWQEAAGRATHFYKKYDEATGQAELAKQMLRECRDTRDQYFDERDAALARAEAAERERDELRAIMKAGHTRKACVGREPVYSIRCSACTALARAEAAERDREALRKELQRCVSLLPPVKFASLVREVKDLLAATTPPEPSASERRRE